MHRGVAGRIGSYNPQRDCELGSEGGAPDDSSSLGGGCWLLEGSPGCGLSSLPPLLRPVNTPLSLALIRLLRL